MLSILWSLAFAQDTFSDAEVPPINTQRFRPTIDGRRTLWTDDAKRGLHKTLLMRPLFHYTSEPFVYQDAQGNTTGLVNNVLQADLIGGFSFDRLRLGIDLPVYLFSQSDVVGNQSGLGDLAVDTKLSFLNEDAPIDLALDGRLSFPTGSVKNPLAARNTGWELTAIVDRDFGDLLLAINLGMKGGPKTELENVQLDDFFIFRAAAAYAVNEGAGVALEFNGDLPLAENAVDVMPMEWLGSGYVRIAEKLVLRGGFGTGVTAGIGAPDWRTILGIGWEPRPKHDREGLGNVEERSD